MSNGGVISGQEYGWTFCHWKPGSCHGQMRKINNPYDRTFVPIVPWADTQIAIRLVDWDHDGDLDAIGVQTNGSASFYEFLPKEERFVEHALLEALPSDDRLDVEIADWDGDGDWDLIQCAWDARRLVLFENLGNGSFASQNLSVTFADPVKPLPFCFIQAVDWDNDGDVDLMLNNQYFERSRKRLDELSGSKHPLYQILNRSQKYTERVVLADWDADGDLDALTFDFFNPCPSRSCTLGGWHFFERLNDGSFSEHQNWDNPFSELAAGPPERFLVVEWNGDGLPDFLFKQMHIYLQEPYMDKWTARLSAANPFQGLLLDAGEPHFVDWNLDGRMDLLFATGQDIKYFERQREGGLQTKNGCFENVTVALGMRLAAADWDGDGDVDLIILRPGEGIEYYEREGDSLLQLTNHSFAAIDTAPGEWGSFVDTLQPLVVDWDLDGDLDLILAPAGRFFRRQGETLREDPNSTLASLANHIMTSTYETRWRPMPYITCVEHGCDKILAWKILDLDFDGQLDVLQVKGSKLDDYGLFTQFFGFRFDAGHPMGFHDFQFRAPVNNDKSRFYSRFESPFLDLADWNGDGGYDVLEVTHDGQTFFWMGGFCKPDNACERHGVCQEATGTCACSAGYQLHDCSGCEPGFFTEFSIGHLSHACWPCSGAEDHQPCHQRGVCYDDEAAVQIAKQQNWSNTSVMSAKGTGQCTCSEPYFGGFNEAGQLSCAYGSCPTGWQEVPNLDQTHGIHQCEACYHGSISTNGLPCKACPAGHVADQNRSECVPCSQGHVAALAASHECRPCLAGSYANRNATACWPCGDNAISPHASADCFQCEGIFFAWEADAEHQTCQVSPIGVVALLSFFACLLGIFWILAFARLYVLRITNLSVESEKMVLSTLGRHRLKKWRRASPPVQVVGTGVPPLEAIAEAPYKVTPLHPDQLVLLHPDGKVEPWDTSMGEVHLKFPATLLYIRFLSVPLFVWLILLLCGSFVAVLMPFLPWPSVLITAAAAVLAFFLTFFWRWYWRRATPLERRRKEFLQHFEKPQPCQRGPHRALTVSQLEHFHQFFESFIRDRSMYYIYANLVKPLTVASKLSYAELVGSKMVDWFVSHYWGTPFRHFWETVRKHSQTLDTASSSPAYWICTFSNNQWAVDEELGGGNVLDSSFYLSLTSASCLGTVMVIDEKALPLTRAWCLFEVLQTLSMSSQHPHFQGLLLCTPSGVLRDGRAGTDVAMATARRLAVLDLRDAEASCPKDLQLIRTEVERRPGGFDEMNRFVRASIRDSLLSMHACFEQDFQELLRTLQVGTEPLQTAQIALQSGLPTLLTSHPVTGAFKTTGGHGGTE